MYMYYFLGHELWSKCESTRRKDVMARNTFLLALDGDVDFKPDAVILLIDLMKRNQKVGAACGRIHPIGSGMNIEHRIWNVEVTLLKFRYLINKS